MFSALTANERGHLVRFLAVARIDCDNYWHFFGNLGRPKAHQWRDMATEMQWLFEEIVTQENGYASYAEHSVTHDRIGLNHAD